MSIFHVIFAEDGNGSGGSKCERTFIYLILHCTCIYLIAIIIHVLSSCYTLNIWVIIILSVDTIYCY